MKPSVSDAATVVDLAEFEETSHWQRRWRWPVAQEQQQRWHHSTAVRNSQDAHEPRAGGARRRVSAYSAEGGAGAPPVTCAISGRDKILFEIEPKNGETARCREDKQEEEEEEEEEVFEQFTQQIKLHELTETNYNKKEELLGARASESGHHGQRQLNESTKLAATSQNKATIVDRNDDDDDERAATGGGQKTTSGSASNKSKGQQAATVAPKRGLLEALLGNRGKSWLEHKTVILDIQNGKKQQVSTAQDKNNNQNVAVDKSQQVHKLRETFTRLEESGDNNDDDDKRREKSGQRNLNKLPTFGSVPQRLTRLPYFTYHGGQRATLATRGSADITKSTRSGQQVSEDGQQEGRYKLLAAVQHTPRQKAGSVASLGSSAASTTSSGYSPTTAGTTTTPRPRFPFAARRASQLGYSNISNLFPGEPASVRGQSTQASKLCQQQAPLLAESEQQRHRQQHKSASVLDLPREAEQTRAAAAAASGRLRTTPGPQQVALSERRKSHFSALSPMTRRNSFTSLQQQNQQQTQHVGGHPHTRPHSQQSLTQRHEQQQQQQRQMGTLRRQPQLGQSSGKFGARSRPLSATGGYLGGGHQRSPSASSAYRLGSAGMSPLVDPDCPVHGDSPEQPEHAGPGRRRATTASDYTGNRQPIYSSSQPDLFYGGGGRGVAAADRDDLYDPYNKPYYPIYDTAYQHLNGASSGKHQVTPPQYSPVSPNSRDYNNKQVSSSRYGQYSRSPISGNKQPPVNGGGGTNGQPAYYDGSSRFSLYHPAAAAGAASEPGQVRSSLAPTSDQLRRIIGYRPAPAVPRPVHLHPQWAYSRPFIHLKPAGSGFGRSPTPPLMVDPYDPDGELIEQFMDSTTDDTPKFAPFNRLQDNQAIRAVDFHPSGEVYAIGSNSRALRICAYPAEHELRHFDPFDPQRDLDQDRGGAGGQGEGGLGSSQPAKPPRVLFKFLQVHRGSIYCVSFNPSGQLLATGSNDQTVHIVKYNSITHNPDGEEFRLTMHNGTIRDLCFIDDSSGNGSSLLLSAGGGDNKIYVTDCDTITPFQSMAGHTQMVMALSHCGGAQFVSGSYDRTIRFWDLRSRSCTSIVSAPPSSPALGRSGGQGAQTGPGAPVCALRVDPSGRLLASGHTDSTCMLYDIRGAKIIQTFKPHDDEIRAISFSPKSYYLLTGGYDGRLVVSDLQGDLTQPLPSACVAESQDKIVQAKWHPADFTFVSTSADKSATLWSLPGEIRN